MAHAVESMFSVRETPWHGLGNVVQDAPTVTAALELAGLDWTVAALPIEFEGKPYPELGNVVQRARDGALLGCVGPRWTPLQNRDAFDWFQPFIDSGAVSLETAGSLHGGRVVWVMARVNGVAADVQKGDEVRAYLLLSNSHDGSTAVRVGFTPIRVVCANTLGFAHRDNNSKLLRVKHTPGVVATLADVRDTVDCITRGFRATAEQYRRIASRRISRADLRKYVTLVLAADERVTTTQEQAKIDAACELAEYGQGNSAGPVTLWTAYNGVTEYLSYTAGRSQDTRLDALWFGKNKQVNDYALQLAVSLAV